MLVLVRRLLVYGSFIALNFCCFIISAVLFDGCTKCYVDSNAERWSMAVTAITIWVWPYLFLTFWIGTKAYAARCKNRPLLPLLAAFFFGFVVYSSTWLVWAGIALRCGKDCFPPHRLAYVFETAGHWGFFIGLVGLFVCYLKEKAME